MLAELEEILMEMRAEIVKVREANREHSRHERSDEYAQNTMYITGVYKGMSIVSDFVRKEINQMDKWADLKSKEIND